MKLSETRGRFRYHDVTSTQNFRHASHFLLSVNTVRVHMFNVRSGRDSIIAHVPT